jgi:hypothetical protein
MPTQSLAATGSMYHIAKNGNPEACRAFTRKCPLGNGDHYESTEAAYKALLDGTAKLPNHPKETAKGHTMDSVTYHADDNKFSVLMRSESSAPAGYFVVTTKHGGVAHTHVFKGQMADRKAKLVGHMTNDVRGNKHMYVGSAIEGGKEIEGHVHLDNLLYEITGE